MIHRREKIGRDGSGETILGEIKRFESVESGKIGERAGKGVVDEAEGTEGGDLGESFDVNGAG